MKNRLRRGLKESSMKKLQVLSLGSLACLSAIVSLLLLVLLFSFRRGSHAFSGRVKLNVPGPKPLPFVGNFLEARKYNGLHLMYLDYIKKYGKVFTVYLGGRPSLVVADPELLKQIMVKDFTHFRNRFKIQKTPFPVRNSIGGLRDEDWTRIRKTLNPMFSVGKIKLMVPLIEKSCDTLVEKLENIADLGETVDMLDCFSKLTLEITLSTAFSVDAKMQTGENTEILEKAKAVLRMPYIVLQTARLPFGNLYFRLMAALRGSQPAYLQAVTSEIIKKRRQQGITGRKDLLEFMMMASTETAVGKISTLTDDEILAQSLVFFLDGYDTANNTLTFTLYHLVLHPDIQDKLRSEINEAMETNVRKTPLSEIARNIEYLDCVIKEAQRLCPPAAQVGRECAEDFNLNGIHIPAGTEIVIPIYVMHHDPDAWEDPEKFDPERFRGPGKNARHAFQFLPFGAGPRQCIGMTFALMEIKIALVKILMKFKFVLSPETQVPLEIHPGLNLTAKDGVLVRVLAL